MVLWAEMPIFTNRDLEREYQCHGANFKISHSKTQLKITNMETKEKVLAAMKEAGEPLNAGKIAELTGIDRKEVDKAKKALKKKGAIVSPVRCKWAPAE